MSWPRSSSAPCCPIRSLRSRGCSSTPSTDQASPDRYAGGDWYDVFELGPEAVCFSVGDVMGKGAPAAALMGQVRSAIRAYAVAGQTPNEILTSLDHLFDNLIEERVVTAIVGTINPSTGKVVLCNAGHPPPLIVRADGQAMFCPLQQSLLIASGLERRTAPA